MTLIRRLRVGETIREGDFVTDDNLPTSKRDWLLSHHVAVSQQHTYAGGPGVVFREVPQRFEIRGGDTYYTAREQFDWFITPETMAAYGQWVVDVADAYAQGGDV